MCPSKPLNPPDIGRTAGRVKISPLEPGTVICHALQLADILPNDLWVMSLFEYTEQRVSGFQIFVFAKGSLMEIIAARNLSYSFKFAIGLCRCIERSQRFQA